METFLAEFLEALDFKEVFLWDSLMETFLAEFVESLDFIKAFL